MLRAIALFLIVLLSCFSFLYAGDDSSKWSVSTSLTYPLANIYTLHVNYRPDNNNELYFGPCFQNFSHDSFTVYGYTLVLGYRRYFWRGLFLEGELYPAYNRIWSKITASYYPGIEMWGEIKIGYKIPFGKSKFYLQPSPGIGFGIFRTNRPPNYNEEIKSPVFIPQILIGREF